MSVAGAEAVRVEQDKGPEVTYLLEHDLFLNTNAEVYAVHLWQFFLETHPEFVDVERDDEGAEIRTTALTIEDALRRTDIVRCGGDSIVMSEFAMGICTRANKSAKFAASLVNGLEKHEKVEAQAVDAA